MPSSDLILSILHNLTFEDVAPFLRSLRASGCQAKVHFFVCGVKEAHLAKIHEFGVSTTQFSYLSIRRRQPLELFWPIWREVFKCMPSLHLKCFLARWVMHLFGVRWILYRKFLRDQPNAFRNILVSDCRDVLFQCDPFSNDLAPGLHCYQEADGHTIGNCPYNSMEIREAFGRTALANLSAKPVVCAGTTVGDQATLLKYFDCIIELLCSSRTKREDQGAHNFLLYHRLVQSAIIHKNGEDLVRTMGIEKEDAIPLGPRGQVLGKDGHLVPILHQYDRHPRIAQQLLANLDVAVTENH